LRGQLGFSVSSSLKFLGVSVSLEDGLVFDELRNLPFPEVAPSLYCILSGYAEAKLVPETFKLISFRQLPGGHAYYGAFVQRAVQPIERVFGSRTEMLVEVAKLFGGSRMGLGDYSVKIYSLPFVPVHVVLWSKSPEFPVSANMLFDSSISHYLTTEQIAMLGEFTSFRLRHGYEVLSAKPIKMGGRF